MVRKVGSVGSSKMDNSIKKRLGTFKTKPGVVDARQKIMQMKRNNVKDARDILANMAKKQDARSKLQKMRERRGGADNVRVIGTNILKKTDRNGKVSLVTNKPKVSDLNLAIQQQLGLLTSNGRATKKAPPKRSPPVPKVNYAPPPIIRKTILNDYTPSRQPYPFEQPDLYRWVHPNLMTQSVDARRGMRYNNMEMRAETSNRISGYVDLDAVDDEEMPMAPTIRPSLKRNIHSRLDSMPTQAQTHGILANSLKAKVVIPVGHRIVVSNLQGAVTEDDIRELFEDIGELLVARLVRPGTAEVIYKNLKDAQKAVETYHNRQLDGQPMKCLLVNKRPINNPTAPAINSLGVLATRKSSAADSNKLIPDLSTIHKVLFQRD